LQFTAIGKGGGKRFGQVIGDIDDGSSLSARYIEGITGMTFTGITGRTMLANTSILTKAQRTTGHRPQAGNLGEKPLFNNHG
jgi:hypothetical protein